MEVADPFYSLLIRHQHLRSDADPQSGLHALIAYRFDEGRQHRLNDPEVALAAMIAYVRLGFATGLWRAAVVNQYCQTVLRDPHGGPRVCGELARLRGLRCTIEEAGQEIDVSLRRIRSPQPQSV